MKYTAHNETAGTEQPAPTLDQVWQWLCSEFPGFNQFYETAGQFRYWFSHRNGAGIAADFVKAGICRDEAGNEVFRFRVERGLSDV